MSSRQLGARVATVYEFQSAILAPQLKTLGVAWSTFQLLTTIQASGDTTSQAEIARRLGLAPATLSESVQLHVKKGLIEQVRHPHDARVRALQLTDLGKALMKKIQAIVNANNRLLEEALTPEEATECARLLDKLIAAVEKAHSLA
jgi:DNA-binding MarR family transcriptional regulator